MRQENNLFLYADVVDKLHKIAFLLTIDYAARQAYNVSGCHKWHTRRPRGRLWSTGRGGEET